MNQDNDYPEWLQDDKPESGTIDTSQQYLVVCGQPSFEAWYNLWQNLKERDAAMPWLLGDLMVYGESAYGEKASQVLDDDEEQHHFTPGTLKQYRYVSRAWPQSSRLDAIPWSYHQAVSHLPMEQRLAVLQHCIEHGTKRAELRQMVRELNGGQSANPPARLDDVNFELTETNHKQERRIAELEQKLEQSTMTLEAAQIILPDAIPAELGQPIQRWLTANGYESVTIYQDRIEIR